MAKQSLGDFMAGLVRLISARPRIPAALAGNQALRTVLERRSVRKFTDADLSEEAWAAILEAGRLAPSTVNLQTWSFATFEREQWRDFFGTPLPFGAARAVIVMADLHRSRRVVEGFPAVPLCEYTVGVMNASLAAMNMNIAAEALGIASVMLSETGRTGFYDAGHLSELLELPAGVVPLMTIVFGHARGNRPAMPPKLPRDAVSFQGPYRDTPQSVLDEWYQEMQAGYRVSNAGRSFASQVAHYNRRLEEAESDLRRLVLGDAP